MATSIQWTDETWNPVTGCQKVSPGCKHCYAEGVAHRFWGERRFIDVQVHPDRLDQPLRWRKPRRVFVNSMSDLFHEDVPDDFIAQVFAVMALAHEHTFQVLTKRPERMRALVSAKGFGDVVQNAIEEGVDVEWDVPARYRTRVRVRKNKWLPLASFPLPNVWLGVSVEDQQRADERTSLLLETPAAVRFLSCEPLLGTLDLHPWLRQWEAPRRPTHTGSTPTRRLDWLILGGESGPKARPMDLAWARSLVEQGRTAGVPGVPVFVKQLGRRPYDGIYPSWVGSDPQEFDTADDAIRWLDLRDSHGGDPEEWPEDLRVREFPT